VPALKRPAPHSAHCRSLLALAATVVRKPGPHGALTGWHAAPLSTLENVEPAVHAAHPRFVMADPLRNRPWPTGHVSQASQLSVATAELELDLYVPDPHGLHCRSLLAVAATVVWKPGPHAGVAVWQTALLSSEENVTPATQEAHLRSVAAVPTADRPLPVAHVAHFVQLSIATVLALGPALNQPAAQASHVRSTLEVATAIVW
jgi:hypothetical protein